MEPKEMYTRVTATVNHDSALAKINALIERRNLLIDDAMAQLEHLKSSDPRNGTPCEPMNVTARMEDVIQIDTQIWCLKHTADVMQELIDINEDKRTDE